MTAFRTSWILLPKLPGLSFYTWYSMRYSVLQRMPCLGPEAKTNTSIPSDLGMQIGPSCEALASLRHQIRMDASQLFY